MPDSDSAADCHWRVTAYKELVRRVNYLFSSFLRDYCCNCRAVINRLPEAQAESCELVKGVYPGCCHRGAGDIFRLEGEPPERSHLAAEIIDGLQRERKLKIRESAAATCGGTYQLRRRRDNALTTGAHCQYFTAAGCGLGVLKGPLCINFICPPLRADLLKVCAGKGPELVGPEPDFLFIYRSLAIISYDPRERAFRELAALERRVEALCDCCRRFLAAEAADSIYECFNQ